MTTSGSDGRAGARAGTVLVAGGAGFVGRHVARALSGAGFEPVLFGPAMPTRALEDGDAPWPTVEGSVTDGAALAALFASVRPRFVVSCVAHSAGPIGLMRSGEAEAEEAFRVNVQGHGLLLEAAAAAGVRRVVWLSSTVVYGPASDYGGRRVDEDDRTAPTTVYGLTKELAEAVSRFVARRHGMEVVGLRLPLILGRGLWYKGAASAIGDAVSAARDGRETRIAFHDRPVDLMHVADVAEAVLAVLAQDGPLPPTMNLKGFEASMSDLIAALRRARPDARVVLDPTEPSLVFPLVEARRIAAATGFAPRHDLRSLVRDLLAPEPEAHHG